PRPPLSPPFPYPTLFRSCSARVGGPLPDQHPRPCTVLFRYRMVAVGAYGPQKLGPHPGKFPTAPAPSTAGDTTSRPTANAMRLRSEEHTSELQSRFDLVC